MCLGHSIDMFSFFFRATVHIGTFHGPHRLFVREPGSKLHVNRFVGLFIIRHRIIIEVSLKSSPLVGGA